MDQHYQAIYRQAASMQHKFHDYTAGSNAYNPTAAVLRQQIHGLTNDLATNKNPRMIENRLRTIQTHLRTAELMRPATTMQGHGPVLSSSQKNFLHSNFEHMRQNVMQHPHF